MRCTFKDNHILGVPREGVDITFGSDGVVLMDGEPYDRVGELYMQEEHRAATTEDVEAIAAELHARTDAWKARALAFLGAQPRPSPAKVWNVVECSRYPEWCSSTVSSWGTKEEAEAAALKTGKPILSAVKEEDGVCVEELELGGPP